MSEVKHCGTVAELIDPENCYDVDGVNFQKSIVKKEQLDSALSLKPRDDDIFICTYPKSGTTWLQYIVWAVLNIPNDLRSLKVPTLGEMKRTLHRFIDLNGAEGIEDMPTPRVLVTHLPYHLVPKNPKCKYFYVIRDPKDAVVSFWFMLQKVYGLNADQKEAFIDAFIDDKLLYGAYHKNVKSWFEHRNDPNVLVLFYEEMLLHPGREIKRIAKFLSDDKNDYQRLIESDSELLQEIMKVTSFGNLRENHVKSRQDEDRKMDEFFRKGVRGDHSSNMRPDQVEKINHMIISKLGEPFVTLYI